MATFGSGFDPSLLLLLNQQPSQVMANKLTSKVASRGQKLGGDLGKAKQDFLKAVQAGQLQFDPGASEQAALNRMGTGYSGPNSLLDFDDFDASAMINEASGVERDANLLGSSGGLYNLLAEEYGVGDVSPIDVAMAQHYGGQQFANTRDQYGNLLDMFGGQLSEAEQAAWDARMASLGAAGQYRDLYDQRVTARQARERTLWEQQQRELQRQFEERQRQAQRPQPRAPVYTPPPAYRAPAAPKPSAPRSPARPAPALKPKPVPVKAVSRPKPALKPRPKPAPKRPVVGKPIPRKPVAKRPVDTRPAQPKSAGQVRKVERLEDNRAQRKSYSGSPSVNFWR